MESLFFSSVSTVVGAKSAGLEVSLLEEKGFCPAN